MTIEEQGNGNASRLIKPHLINAMMIINTQYLVRHHAHRPSTLSRLAKIAIAITIFSAASYGEGWVSYMALAALFLVYLVAIG